MQEVVANLDHVKFDLEYAIDQHLGVQPLPFTGMDKSGAPVCHFFKMNACQRGANCPFRHVLGNKAVVCKHWLRGLCKKGDQCEFLHEYDMSKMPECYFYARFGRCDNKDCQYQHIDPADKIKDCPWYDRGFCRHGAMCKHRHRRKILCMNYLVGFCPEGGKCKFTQKIGSCHAESSLSRAPWELPTEKIIKCTICNEIGHKATICPRRTGTPVMDFNSTSMSPSMVKLTPVNVNVSKLVDDLFQQRNNHRNNQTAMSANPANPNAKSTGEFVNNRDFSHITCFRCGQKGHYANRCTALGGVLSSLPFRP